MEMAFNPSAKTNPVQWTTRGSTMKEKTVLKSFDALDADVASPRSSATHTKSEADGRPVPPPREIDKHHAIFSASIAMLRALTRPPTPWSHKPAASDDADPTGRKPSHTHKN